ncbi:MmgE/PrpD family protein [Nocardioides mesophilus]|uniref:MmgE/PrpD family protein n=1 Tax=Nocardioides mesophilus TaxID=433659 RepID=A0A7G9RE76_9ACTN|nr:MmgE/PrpD family protein [Nocardioides mesophilus]QNN53901.1 MmgE/PrpD family protein [Nocardioides mesophilus]
MSGTVRAASELASWATTYQPSAADLELADRSLTDTVAVALASRAEPIHRVSAALSDAGRWAVAAHILDFDDLHMPTTTHISTVCVPVALATGSGAAGYLAGAGVMARLGTMLGWRHYASGWHATTTTGALAAAAVASHARGFDAEQTARALALAVPASGGVQRSFGTDAKSLQVGFAVESGTRAVELVAAGASAEPAAVDAWMALVGGTPAPVDAGGPAVPDGLAIKIYPCCYALQRPIAATASLADGVDLADVRRIVVRTPEGTVTPLIHRRPRTGLESKFSLEYAVAVALLDRHPGFASFTDEAVQRPEARRLLELVEVELTPGGDWLLAGEAEIEVHTSGGVAATTLAQPPGSPQRPPTGSELAVKLADCLTGLDLEPARIGWDTAADLLHRHLPRRRADGAGLTA